MFYGLATPYHGLVRGLDRCPYRAVRRNGTALQKPLRHGHKRTVPRGTGHQYGPFPTGAVTGRTVPGRTLRVVRGTVRFGLGD